MEKIATKESKKGWEKSLANVTELEAMNEPTITRQHGKAPSHRTPPRKCIMPGTENILAALRREER